MSLSRRELLYAGALVPLTQALPSFASLPSASPSGPTAEAFEGVIGTAFVARDASGTTHLLRLQAVSPFSCGLGAKGSVVSRGFSAVFSLDRGALPQAVYEFSHDRIGDFPALMVPIRGKDGSPLYEVVFNLLVEK